MNIYHTPESKTEQVLKNYLSNVGGLSGANIVTKFSSNINDETNKTTVAILANECEPDENYVGNWTVKLNVMVMSPIHLDGVHKTNIIEHDTYGGLVTDELSKLIGQDSETLQTILTGVSSMHVDFFKFGNRKQSIDGDYIVTDQNCEMLIEPS